MKRAPGTIRRPFHCPLNRPKSGWLIDPRYRSRPPLREWLVAKGIFPRGRSEPSVRFDDRLATVLAQPVELRARPRGALAAAGRPRRALERPGRPRLARAGARRRSAPSAARCREPLRAAAARAIAGAAVPLALLDRVRRRQPGGRRAAARRGLARPPNALASRPRAPPRRCPPLPRQPQRPAAARARGLRPRRALAPAAEPEQPPEGVPSISEVVARIERLRSSRDRAAAAERARRAPLDYAGRRRCSAGNAGRAARSPGSRARRAGR